VGLISKSKLGKQLIKGGLTMKRKFILIGLGWYIDVGNYVWGSSAGS